MKPTGLLPIIILLTFLQSKHVGAQTIAAGSSHSLSICNDGRVMAWGENTYGQLGDGTNIDKNSPTQVLNLTGIIAVSAGGYHNLALKNDGTVWSWGVNYWGELGDGTIDTTGCYCKSTPVEVSGLTGVSAIAAGYGYSLALKNDGTVWSWGHNTNGLLGDGTQIDRLNPVQVSNLTGVTSISTGRYHSVVLKNDGTVWAWGGNNSGQIDSSYSLKSTPVKIQNLNGVVRVACGGFHTIVLKNDSTVWAWGANGGGELGNGIVNNTTGCWCRSTPVKVVGLSSIKSIEGGEMHSLALRNDNTVWAWGLNGLGQLGDGTYMVKYTPVQIPVLSGIEAIAAGEHHNLAMNNVNFGLAWGNNDKGQIGDGTWTNKSTPVEIINFCGFNLPQTNYPNRIQGYLYNDSIGNCNKQFGENPISSCAIVATPGNLYSISNDSGYYSLPFNDSTNYTIRPIIPQRLAHFLKNPCPSSYNLVSNSTLHTDTSGFDFGFDVVPCQQLRVDVSSNRRRRCFRNYTSVFYINEGLSAASGVEVRVKMGEYDIPVSASMAYMHNVTDNSLVFSIGTLNAQQSGSITIIDSIACINGITGLTQCTQASILPPNQCLIDSTTGSEWDKSSVNVTGVCADSAAQFVVCNSGVVGGGDMQGPVEYRIYVNDSLFHTETLQLLGQDCDTINVSACGNTIRIEVDQRPGHPGHSRPRATVEGCGSSCGDVVVGYVNTVLQDDEDVDVEIDCMEIRDSYDPNEKAVSPQGVGINRIVLPNTLLDYIIHFQNTGSDTAYKVLITDTLSSDMNFATLEPGASSYPYTMSISGTNKPVLIFTFNNINLTDSASNEPSSHGFVKFKIAPKVSTALGTQLNNFANIYFDYNLPIQTNVANVKLGLYNSQTSVRELKKGTNRLIVYPNPTNDKLQVVAQGQLCKIDIYNSLGVCVKKVNIPSSSNFEIDMSEFTSGIYLLNCRTIDGSIKQKVVKQ